MCVCVCVFFFFSNCLSRVGTMSAAFFFAARALKPALVTCMHPVN